MAIHIITEIKVVNPRTGGFTTVNNGYITTFSGPDLDKQSFYQEDKGVVSSDEALLFAPWSTGHINLMGGMGRPSSDPYIVTIFNGNQVKAYENVNGDLSISLIKNKAGTTRVTGTILTITATKPRQFVSLCLAYDDDNRSYIGYVTNNEGIIIPPSEHSLFAASMHRNSSSRAGDILKDFLETFKENDTDPFTPGDESGDGGGGGDFDGESDPIDFPELPDISVVDTGFVNLFNPTIAQLQSLANYMWSDLFSVDTFKKIFADPMDCILGLSIVPVTVPDGGISPVTVGNISTGVNLNKAGSQYVEIDCGTLNVNEYWGAYLDYSPYTNVQLYLPYIGFQHLNIDDVMKKAVHIKYHVDILSGSLCAYVKCGDSVLYSYTGQCSLTIPVNANNFTQMITSIASGLISTGVGMVSGGIGGAVGSGLQSAVSVASSKPTVERSGQLTGMGGILGIQKPYMVLTRPRQCLPSKQNTYTGYPSYTTQTLSNLSGYTEIAEIHLDNVPATSDELAEIEQLLKSGVII